MARNWTVMLFSFGFVLFIAGLGTCMSSRPLRSIGYNEDLNYLATPFTNDVRDYDFSKLSSSTLHGHHGCERDCSPIKRKKRVALPRKLPPQDPLDGQGNSQGVLSPFPTLDPFREKKNKNQRNKLGKGNRSQNFNGLKENNAVFTGGETPKVLNNGSEKRGRKKLLSKKAYERGSISTKIASAHATQKKSEAIFAKKNPRAD